MKTEFKSSHVKPVTAFVGDTGNMIIEDSYFNQIEFSKKEVKELIEFLNQLDLDNL